MHDKADYAKPLPPSEPLHPVKLAGRSASDLEALLGKPGERSREGTGERWTYRAKGCAFDVFLFPDVASGGLTVLDYRGSDPLTDQDCIHRVLDERAP